MNRRSEVKLLALSFGIVCLGCLLGACGLSQLSPATDSAATAQLHLVSETAPLQDEQASLDTALAPTPVPDLGSTRSGPDRPRWVRVRPGDTLWGLAARQDIYGSGWCYPLLIHANAKLLPDPVHPRVGIRLRIPRDVPRARVELAEEEAMTGQLLGKAHARGAAPASPPPSPVPTPTASVPVPTPAPTPTQAPLALPTPFPTPLPARPAPATGFGPAGWLLVLLVVAAFAALIWILRRDHDENR